tara:strand:- start:83374 stop:83679 length:306 start_codon:yes stop_codon:yes gene_type:complete
MAGRMHLSCNNPARSRWDIGARVVAAIAGGYFLTAVASMLLTVLLPVSRVDAVFIATLPTFAIYTCVILWVFATRSALRAWIGVLTLSGLLFGILWLYKTM